MKRLLSSIFVLLSFFWVEAEGQVLPFTHYTTDSELNALPSAEVTQVYQDREGYMWFAIYSSGLVRYNGVTMERYNIEDGLRDVTVWDMIEDPTGRLWASSNAGLIVSEEPLSSYQAGNRISFISETPDISLINVSVNHNRMAVDNNGWLWVGTESLGIVRYRFNQQGQLEADTLSTKGVDSDTEIPVRSLFARQNGTVWVALLDGVLLEFTDRNIINTYDVEGDVNVNALYETPGGELWGGMQNGKVWRLNESDNKSIFREVESLANSNIADITSDSRGAIWISSEGGGLQKIEEGNEQNPIRYTRSNGLLSEIIFNVLEDREQNLWIAQSGGISKLRYNYEAFTNIVANSLAGEKPMLPSPAINSVLPFQSARFQNPCSILAGTTEGGLACVNKSFESEFISQEDGLTGNWVNGLAFDMSGRLWIGTSRGLNSITFNNARPVEGAQNIKNVSVLGNTGRLAGYRAASILAVHNLLMPEDDQIKEQLASVWLPAYQAVYAVVDDKLYTLDQSWGLPAVIYHAAAFDDEGHLWLGTRDRGIYKSISPFSLETLKNWQPEETGDSIFQQFYSTENGFPTNQIDNLLWHNGKMWAGTPSGLIALSDEPSHLLQHITKDDGLLADNVTSMALSSVTQTFWAGTNQGLAEIDPETGTVIQTVTKADGLVDNEVWFYGSVKILEEGTIYFGTAKGISIYKPLKDLENNHAPIVKLTNAAFNEVPGERNEFAFEYAALSFGNERQVRYQTRLIGFNEEWSPISKEVRANYTNLPAYFFPKTYTFEVKAVNESGVWSEEQLSYSFSVVPPPWLRWWAFLGYLFIFSVGVFIVDRIQRSRLIKKEREAAFLRETELKAETAIARSKTAEAQAKVLKAENDLKTTELEKARALEQAYNELKSTQARLIQAEKMASLGRLSTGIAHEIKNPLNFINNFAELSTELVEELKEAINKDDISEIEILTKNLNYNTQKIEEHGKRADAIVQSMMQHSQSGDSNFDSVNINDLVIQYTDLAFHSNAAKYEEIDIQVSKDLDHDLPPLRIISQQIGQVLQNIIENSFDAVCEKSLSEGADYKPTIKIFTKRIGQEAEVCITDNGPGIAEEAQEKIFEPFYTTKPTGEGTGLGLSISYDIITQVHNGSLKVESSSKGETSFIIRLPLPKHAHKV